MKKVALLSVLALMLSGTAHGLTQPNSDKQAQARTGQTVVLGKSEATSSPLHRHHHRRHRRR